MLIMKHIARADMPDLTLEFSNRPGINIELKTELGKGSNNPIEQNAFYYVHLTNDNDCLDPMFLISIVGCNFLQVFGAIHHGERDEVLLDPLCDPVSLLHVPDDLLHGEVKVARVLEAIAGAKSELAEYYAEPHSGVQPYYNCDGNLQYIKSINRNVWEAKLTKDGVTKSVIAKFTTQYSSDVHKCLYEYGMAPGLIDIQVLAGGWKFVLMEKIEGKTLYEMYSSSARATHKQQKSVIQQKLKEAVSHMNHRNFVHGDLRTPNIMIREAEITSSSPTPIILDFDWAGTEGIVKYPSHLNPNANWPISVKPFIPIKNAHDEEMVNNLFC